MRAMASHILTKMPFFGHNIEQVTLGLPGA